MSYLNEFTLQGKIKNFKVFQNSGGRSLKFKIMTVAYNRNDPDNPHINFIEVTAFKDDIIDLFNDHVQEDTRLTVKGTLSSSKYERNGKTIYDQSVLAHYVQFLDPKPEEDA